MSTKRTIPRALTWILLLGFVIPSLVGKDLLLQARPSVPRHLASGVVAITMLAVAYVVLRSYYMISGRARAESIASTPAILRAVEWMLLATAVGAGWLAVLMQQADSHSLWGVPLIVTGASIIAFIVLAVRRPD